MNADGTIYGRFGSRSDLHDSERDISLEGLRGALDAALRLHKAYPANKAMLSGKIGPRPAFAEPVAHPWIKGLLPNCIHCHHIGAADRMRFRATGKPMPDKLLYAWPMPDVIGLRVDPKKKATVLSVAPKSPGERAAFRPGDEILLFGGQPVISTADLQWVLDNAGDDAKLEVKVSRAGKEHRLTLNLEKGWRRRSDISWRPTTYYLRHFLLGDLMLDEMSADGRREAGIEEGKLALRQNRILPKYRPAYQAGFRRSDIVVNMDGQTGRMSETEILADLWKMKKPGDKIPVTVLRAGKPIDLELLVK